MVRACFAVAGWLAITACGGGEGASSVGIQSTESFACSGVARRAGTELVWCPALGGTCASPAACRQLGGSEAGAGSSVAPVF